MPMPRVISGTAPSASVFNALAQGVDNLGIGVKVFRTVPQTNITTSTDSIVTWSDFAYDSFAGTDTPMISGASASVVNIRVDGVYSFFYQVRWAAVSSGAPYNQGQRAIKLMINGSSAFTNTIASDKRAADTTGEGVTCSVRTSWPCHAGDAIYCNFWQSSGSTITGLHTDFGGTFLSVDYRGPLVA